MMVAPLAMRLERTLDASSGERVRVCGANVVGCAVRVTVTVIGPVSSLPLVEVGVGAGVLEDADAVDWEESSSSSSQSSS